jgi:membrane glycosyltransferase
MPEIRRASMVSSRIDRRPLRRLWAWITGANPVTGAKKTTARTERKPGWRRTAHGRRLALILLVLAQTGLAAWSLERTFPHPALSALEIATLGVFAILWIWISFGFWTAVVGFWALWRRSPSISDVRVDRNEPLRSRTAIVVPICNEEIGRVFAGVEATYRSLAATGCLDHFDFYVLSDTRDPEQQVAEEIAWADTCRAVDGFGRMFYRHRRNNIKRKSGNIADFLRRWGQNYTYMIVFDADSVMAGTTLVRLVRLMDDHPETGIMQTVPRMVGRETLFARMQQFASRAYGPMLAAGLRFWQLGESYYWGHNAILRLEPFMRHCGLGRLPGRPPLGGEILSHDFVEGALMGRAGWDVWIASDLDGSYEETPPTLLDELKRDRRWCQGNMQHARLLLGDGIRSGHRAIMATGVMSYLSALIWAVFLLLTVGEVSQQLLSLPDYFASGPSLFPLWPRWHPELALTLLSTTAFLLFFPKLLSVLLIARNRRATLFGSLPRLLCSVVFEILLSALLAPVRMWFHSKFVLVTLMGRQIGWGTQCRTDSETSWTDAFRQHGVSAAVALGVLICTAWFDRALLYWVVPVAGALVLSIPVSVYTSRVSPGRALRRWRLFLIPEEVEPPEILRRLRDALDRRNGSRKPEGFVFGTDDAQGLGVHVALMLERHGKLPATQARHRSLVDKALTHGPASLTSREKARLLRDPASVIAFQHRITGMADLEPAHQPALAQRR